MKKSNPPTVFEVATKSAEDTLSFARQWSLLSVKPGDIICLTGPLGAGKTLFSKGVISSLSNVDVNDIQSPTFTYVSEYDNIKHFDLYRLQSDIDFLSQGFDEYLGFENICLIEWPDIAMQCIKNHPYYTISIEYLSASERTIKVEYHDKLSLL